MRKAVATAAVAALLSACQTAPSAAQGMSSVAGSGQARPAQQTDAAQASLDSGRFSIACAGERVRYRFDRAELLHGDCERYAAPPMLARQHALSTGHTMLMIMYMGAGVVNEGTVIRADRDAMIAIHIDNMESFGDVLADDRIVVHGGTIDQTECGMTMWSKELTLDWENARIASVRELPRAQPDC